MQKQYQISSELLTLLIRYFLLEDNTTYEQCKKGVEAKLNAAVNRDLYTKMQVAPTPEEREQARQEYLDRIGMHPDFRWGTEYEQERRKHEQEET